MKRSHPLIASSSSSCPPQNNYDVFLSFREDTRNNFTSHLDKALCQKGIHTFLDDDEMDRGKAISTELRKAIEASRCSIVILSRDYASSRWCLDELVKILQCMKESKQIVLPIFYHVDPSHVRKQIGSIGEAFQRHEQVHNVQKVNSWRAAFTEVGNLAGYHLQDDRTNEAIFIEDFIKVVSSNLGVPLLNISKDLVGMDSKLEELELLISSSPFKDVCFIGICGMGGVGKTTLARAYFEYMSCRFEASSFLANVREVCEYDQKNGLVKLQKQLLTEILKGKRKIHDVDQGIGMIRTRLCNKKVLVILDDVNQSEQLKGLAQKNNWFGYGSRIILTTRDERVLKETYKKDYIIHKVEELKDSEAFQLFSRNAFESDCPTEDYRALSEKVVKSAKGLPLALKVLGSFLGTCESIDEWKSALERLKKYPEEDIMKTLQVSFDGLKETEKNIFLDIACFFNGYSKDFIMKFMDGCGFFPEIGIRSLVDKSLLHMDHDNKLRMHDLLEEMGKEIVRKESCNEPGRRSRIWLRKDLDHVMNNDTATEEVEAIVCRRCWRGTVSLRGFSIMKKLRLLIIDTYWWSERDASERDAYPNNEHLSNELRYLEWKCFQFNSFPPTFQPHGLVELILYRSDIKQLWKNLMKPLYNLKSIDLTWSKEIRQLEGFSLFPNLEELILDCCTSLEEIHPSITVLKRLTVLRLRGCQRLKSLPTSIDGLESLRVLNLFGCLSLCNLPEDFGSLNNLEELDVRETYIKDFSTIGDLKALKSLTCGDHRLAPYGWKNTLNIIVGYGFSSARLYCLEILNLRNCHLFNGAFPDDFECLVSLKYLNLSGNYFSCLPARFNQLSKLRDLDLSGCRQLTSLGPELPDSLIKVTVNNCGELHTFLDPLSQCNLRCSTILCIGCIKLVNRQGSEMTAITSLERYLQNPPRPTKRFDIVLPGYEVPSWFTHQVRSSSISLLLHQNWCTDKWMGFALSACSGQTFGIGCSWQIKINQLDWVGHVDCREMKYIGADHLWLLFLPRDAFFRTVRHKKFDYIQFSLNYEVKQCGVRLVYEQGIDDWNLATIHEPIELPSYEFFSKKCSFGNCSDDDDFC